MLRVREGRQAQDPGADFEKRHHNVHPSANEATRAMRLQGVARSWFRPIEHARVGARGVVRLASATRREAFGTTLLASGTARQASGTARQASGTAREAWGSTRLASGNTQLASGNTPLARGTVFETRVTAQWPGVTHRGSLCRGPTARPW
jgi:X-X-X-Leu-X-X-Gly heptad repeat protein